MEAKKNIPNHIAFIMDGNRRWARVNGLPTLEGHRRGYNKFKDVSLWCLKKGITTMTVYAFSTENWNRSKEEVDYLMALLHRGLTSELNEFHKQGIKLRIIGERGRLSGRMRKAIETAETETADYTKGTLYIALNYGGQQEIVEATKKIIKSGAPAESVNLETLAQNLYAPEASEPDLIIRTSGEQRLSGFLLWGSAYSELYFTKKYWPDFTEADLDNILEWFRGRERRWGK